MQVTIEIPDALAERIKASGDSPQHFMQEWLRRTPMPEVATASNKTDLDEFFRQMAQFSATIPHLPDEALTRESIYRDHD